MFAMMTLTASANGDSLKVATRHIPYYMNSKEQDTLTVVRPNSVTIITGVYKTQAEIVDNEGNVITSDSLEEAFLDRLQYEYDSLCYDNEPWNLRYQQRWRRQKRQKKNNIFCFHPGINFRFGGAGHNGTGSTPEFDSGGWEIWWANTLNLHYENKKSHLGADLQAGLLFREFMSPGDKQFDMNGDAIQLIPAESTLKRSTGTVFSTTLSLTAHYKFDEFTKLSIGPVLNINWGYGIYNVFKEGKKTTTDDWESSKPRKVTIDWLASFQWGGVIGLYYKFSPTSLFKPQYGPEFTTHTFGVNLGW